MSSELNIKRLSPALGAEISGNLFHEEIDAGGFTLDGDVLNPYASLLSGGALDLLETVTGNEPGTFFQAGLMIENLVHDNFISLDNAIWAHRPIDWTDWYLCSSVCDIGVNGAMYTRRQVFDRAGDLVASIAQEAIHIDPS